MIIFGHPGFLLLLDNILKVAVLAIVATFFLVLELLFGSLLWAIFRKKWLLYAALPITNCAIYVVLLPKIALSGKAMTIGDQFCYPQIEYTVFAWLCLIPLGLLSAEIVLLLAWLIGRFSTTGNKSPQPEGRPWQQYLECPQAGSFASAFKEGVSAPQYGLSYLLDHPGLWRYAVIPLVLNIIVTVAAFFLFVAAVIGIIMYLHPLFSPTWGWRLLEIACGIALVAVALVATLVFWMLMQAIFCGIFHGRLARKVELQLGLSPESLKDAPLGEQITDTLGGITLLVAVNGGLLFLNLVPILGWIASVAGGFYYDCSFVGREYLDYPLSLRGLPRREKLKFIRKYRGQTLGLGTVVFFTNFIPLVGFVTLVTAVAGSVLLHRRLAGCACRGAGEYC
jgi:CysZ protein